MVYSKRLRAVLRGFDASLTLNRHCCVVPLTHGGDLRWARLHVDAAASAVVAHAIGWLTAIACVVVNHRALIDGPNLRADSRDGAVVVEVVAAPVAAEVANADVTEPVVDTTVVADVASPVARVEAVVAAVPTPVGWRPKRAIVRRLNPGAGNPVVAVRSPGPVTRGPDVVGAGRGRLVIFRERRRSLCRLFKGFLARLLIWTGLIGARLLRIALLDGSRRLLWVGFALLLRAVGNILSEHLGLPVGRRKVRVRGIRARVRRIAMATGGERKCAR